MYINIFWNKLENKDADKKSLISLIRNIDYKRINKDEFKNKFFYFDFENMLGNYYEYFINDLYIKVNDFESFNSFIIFFDFEKKQQNRNNFEILSLFEKFKIMKKKLKTEKKKDYYQKIIKLFLCLYHYNIKEKINDIFDVLQIKPINYKFAINLLFSYINDLKNNESFLKNYIFNYIQIIYKKYFTNNCSFIFFLFLKLKVQEIKNLYEKLFPNMEKSQFYNNILLQLNKSKEIDEIEILNIINLFWDNFENKKNDKQALISLIKIINYKQIKNKYTFSDIFFSYNFSRFGEYYCEFLNHLFTQIEDLESFDFFFQFFNFQNKFKNRNKYEIVCIFERFIKIKNQLNIFDIKRILKIFFILFHYNIKDQMDYFYNSLIIESKDYKIPIEILTEFINNSNRNELFIKDYSMQYLKIIFDKSYEENFDFIYNLFNSLKESNVMDVFILLFPNFRNSKANFYKNKISKEIKKKAIKGIKILNYIQLLWNKFDNNNIEKTTLVSLIGDLDYNDIINDDNFKTLFFSSNFLRFGTYYKVFINSLFSKINDLNSFDFYLKFFDFENNTQNRNVDEIYCFFESFQKIKNEINKNNMERIIKIFIILFHFNYSDKDQKINQIFIELENWAYNSKDIIDILTKLINNSDLNNSFLKNYIEKYFIINIQKNDDDYIIEILINLNDFDLTEKIIKLKFPNEINENIFYMNDNFQDSQNNTKNIINFLLKLSTTKFFQGDYYNIPTMNKIKSKIKNMESKLKIYNITLKEAKKIIDNMNDDELQKRFIIIENGNLNSAKISLNSFKLKIQKCNQFILKVIEVILFIKTFFNENNNIIENYSKKIENIENEIVSNEFFNGDQNFYECYELSKKYKIFYKSLFFLSILENIKKDFIEKSNQENRITYSTIKKMKDTLENTLNEFLSLKDYFITGNVSDDLLFKISIKIINIDEIQPEINFCKEYFKIPNVNEKFILLLEKKVLEQPIRNLKQLIDDFEVHKTELYSILEKRINKIKHLVLEGFANEVKQNNQITKFLSSIQSKQILNQIYYKINDHVRFLIEAKIELIEQLYEFINIGNTYVTVNDLNAFKICSRFLQKLSKNDINDEQLLNDFILLSEKENFKQIIDSFTIIGNNYYNIKNLFRRHFDINAKRREEIENIYKESIFELKYEFPKYNCNIKNFNMSFNYVLNLRDDALLKKGSEVDEEFIKKIDSFVTFIKLINDIIYYSEIINSKGSHEDANYEIKILNGKGTAIKIGENIIIDIELLLENIKNQFENQTKSLKQKYLEYPLLRFINGRMFNKLNNAINSNSYSKEIYYINKYLTNNNYQNSPKLNAINTKIQNNDKLEKMYLKINYYIESLYKINNLTLKKIFNIVKKKDNLELINFKFPGIKLTKYSINENIEEKVIKLYKLITGNLPISHVILYCNENTNQEEIISFLYRSIFSEDSYLFVIIKPENLKEENKRIMLETIKELCKELDNKSLDIKSCLYFLCYDIKSDIIEAIKFLPYFKEYIPDLSQINYKFDNIEVYSSNKPGLGKSTIIKNKFLNNNNLIYKYFPLGGEINRKNLMDRLLELNTNTNYGFHLDLYDSKKTELIKEFLFYFLITKFYSKNEYIFYYGNELNIKIEIPSNIFEDFKKKYPILTLFNNIPEIKTNNRPKLIIDNDINSNFQFTFNYLNKYSQNKIDLNNIKIEQITNVDLCEQLLKKFLNINNPNYYQITSFISIIGTQLKLFHNNIFLDIRNINENALINNNLKRIRSFFINCLINVTKHFIKSAYSNILEEQEIINKYQNKNYDEEEAEEEAKKKLSERKVVSYDQIEPSLMVFNNDGQSITFISTGNENDNEKNILNAFLSTQTNNKIKSPTEYSKLKSEDFYEELIKLLDLHRKIIYNEKQNQNKKNNEQNNKNQENNIIKVQSNKHQINKNDKNKQIKNNYDFDDDNNNIIDLNQIVLENEIDYTQYYTYYKEKYWQSIDEIVDSYIFTSDNFIKLILIITRIKSNLPVILMGETGCGKTSLIRILYDLQFKYVDQKKDEEMLIYNIHAGITDNDIINFIKNNNLLENNNNNREMYNEKWVFFDEINTCNSMGLLSEILCKHTMLGIKLKPNIKFIAACNPYRLVTNKIEKIGLINEKKHIQSKLVYTVNPLPPSLLNYIFDFGNLKEEDEKKYIYNIIEKGFKDLIDYYDLRIKMVNLAKNAIFASQNFIRKNYEISAVSLREIRRFILLFKWFYKYLRKIYKKKINKETLFIYSINLGIYLCYFIRLFQKNLRKNFCEEMKKYFGNNYDFERIPKELQTFISKNIDFEKGIALNQSLLENLFCLFICIINKIPLFIVGKPGCSKSLSILSILKCMNGKDSTKSFFKDFPKVRTFKYQGSLISTSEGIKEVFNNARKGLNQNEKDEIIPLIFFEEMGLAEISENNPLKVIHSELEYDEQRIKVSFVGISNWSLDASKMNRGIYLSIPELEQEDLINTALSISESYSKNIKDKYKNYIESLAKTYFDYRKYRKNENHKKKINFHGSRDFYYLIKYVSREYYNKIEIKNEKINDHEKEKVLIEGIERNFGGLDDSVNKFKEIFKKYYKYQIENNYNALENIEKNLNDEESRYLLVICKTSISRFLIEYILKKENKTNFHFLLEGNFIKQSSQEYYIARILNKIQTYMNTETVLIMKNMELIYPSLYELFNQSFTKQGTKKMVRIALGNSFNPDLIVNDKFKIIIIVDPEEIEKQDPPFLNRFEKHIISFDSLLNNELKQISSNIENIINRLINDKNIIINLNSQLINCDKEEICSFLYYYNEIINDNESNLYQKNEKYIYEFLLKVVPLFSQDIITYISKIGDFKNNYNNYYNKIIKIYNDNVFPNLKIYLENISKNKHIIYTFSDILSPIFNYNQIYKNKYFGDFDYNNSFKIIIENCSSDEEFDDLINRFFNNNSKNICFIQFNEKNCISLSYIKYKINELITQKLYFKKVIIIIIHLKRKFKKEDKIYKNYFIPLISDYNQIFIDNLNGINLKITDLLLKSNNQLLFNNILINFNQIFNENLYYAFMLLNHKFLDSDENEEGYIEKCINYIKENEVIQNIIINKIQKYHTQIISNIFYKNNIIKKNSSDFISIISTYLKELYLETLIQLIIKIDREGFLSVIVNNNISLNTNNILSNISNNYLELIELKDLKFSDKIKNNLVIVCKSLKIPGSLEVILKTINYVETIKTIYFDNEINTEKENEDYNNTRIIYKKNVEIELEKYDLIKVFKKYNNLFTSDIFDILIEDYFTILLIQKDKENYKDYHLKEIFKFLKIIYSKLIVETENKISKLADIILFFECFSDYIIPLLSLVNNLNKMIDKECNDIFERFINNLNLKDENGNKKSKIKKFLFEMFNFIINYIFMNYNKFENLNDLNILNKIIKSLENVSICIMKANINMKLCLYQIYNLQTFFKINNIFKKINNYSIQNIIKYLNFFHINSIIENIKKERIPEEQLNEIIIGIYINNYLYNEHIDKKSFKIEALNNILKSNKLLSKSKYFIKLIIQDFNIIPEMKEEYINDFPKIITTNENNNIEIIKILNENQSIFLNEILFQIFETSINSFFSKQNIFQNILIKYFFKCVSLIEDKIEHGNTGNIYCIAYIKCFCYNLVKLISNNSNNIKVNLKKHFNINLLQINTPFRKMIKLFILKTINLLNFKSYQEFKNYNFINNGITWINEFFDKEKKENNSNLSFSFFNPEFINLHYQYKKEMKMNNFKNIEPNIINSIKQNGLEHFYDFIINNYISKLKNQDYNEKFCCNILKILFSINEISKYTFQLLQLFLLKNYYLNLTKNVIKNLTDENFEIFLYSYKICLICSNSPIDSFYHQLTGEQINDVINSNYIPGGEPNDALIIQNLKEIESFFIKTNSPSPGLYVCSCGYFYTVDNCSLPYRIFKCPICKLDIGGEHHELVKRNGHFRVFYNREQQKIVTNYSYYVKMDNMILSEFKELVNNEKKKEWKGFRKVSQNFFILKDKEIRGLSQICYRLLSFIFYSLVYFAKLQNYEINESDYLFKDNEDIDLFSIIKINWMLLKEELSNEGINEIQIFLNMIFPQLKNILNDSSFMTTIEKRKDFESKVNNLVEECKMSFDNYKNKFIHLNNEIMKEENYFLKSILMETINISEINEDEYPYYKYFILSKYPSMYNLQVKFDSNEYQLKYPIISSYIKLLDSTNYNDLKNLQKLNQFENYILNRHSYNLTRKESRIIKIKEDLIKINDKNIVKMYNNFENGYNNLSHLHKNTDYICIAHNPTMKNEKKISKNDCLAFVLNDKGDPNYGMYLGVYYHELIKIQNSFLNPIIANSNHPEIEYLKNKISNEIYIQKATPFEIINLDLKNSQFNNFDDLINTFTYRDCLNFSNSTINYSRYREFKYDFDKIEVELGKIILPGKRMFKIDQIYVTYGFEGYNGDNSVIIQLFKEKYQQSFLNVNNRNNLLNIIQGKDYKNILFSIEMIFNFLVNIGNTNINDTISKFLKSLPKYIIIKQEFISIFESLPNLKITNLLHIYELVEKYFVNEIFDNIEEIYKVKIDNKDLKFNILNYNDRKKLITKLKLGEVVRKFISRFLSGNRSSREINEDFPLFDYIQAKEELWPDEILNERNTFENEIQKLSKKFNVLVCNSIDFYYQLTKDNM